MKSSSIRSIKSKILQLYPEIAAVIDLIIPKKSKISSIKCRDQTTLISVDSRILFVQSFDGPYYPTLQLLHQYPDILPKVQVDRGAIKFVMKGADIMCPGLTSKGASLPRDLPVDTIVTVMAEGKQTPLGVGQLRMSSEDM